MNASDFSLLPNWSDGLGDDGKRLPEPPDSLARFDTSNRERLRDVWVAAHRLLGVIEAWQEWWRQLRTTGEADFGVGKFRYPQAARQAIDVLCALGVNMPPFSTETPQAIKARLPPVPDEDDWQEQLQNYRRLPLRLPSGGLNGSLRSLISRLKHYPAAVLMRTEVASTGLDVPEQYVGRQPAEGIGCRANFSGDSGNRVAASRRQGRQVNQHNGFAGTGRMFSRNTLPRSAFQGDSQGAEG